MATLFGRPLSVHGFRCLQRVAVHDIEPVLGLVGHVEEPAIRCRGDTVVDLDTADLAHDLVGRRIDQVEVVASRIRLHDHDAARLRRQALRDCQDEQRGQRDAAVTHCDSSFHSGSVFDGPSFPARMKRRAARFVRERHQQQPACFGLARDNQALDRLEVLARFLFGPGPPVFAKSLQPERRAL